MAPPRLTRPRRAAHLARGQHNRLTTNKKGHKWAAKDVGRQVHVRVGAAVWLPFGTVLPHMTKACKGALSRGLGKCEPVAAGAVRPPATRDMWVLRCSMLDVLAHFYRAEFSTVEPPRPEVTDGPAAAAASPGFVAPPQPDGSGPSAPAPQLIATHAGAAAAADTSGSPATPPAKRRRLGAVAAVAAPVLPPAPAQAPVPPAPEPYDASGGRITAGKGARAYEWSILAPAEQGTTMLKPWPEPEKPSVGFTRMGGEWLGMFFENYHGATQPKLQQQVCMRKAAHRNSCARARVGPASGHHPAPQRARR